MKLDGGGPDDLDPPVERELFAMLPVDLDPGLVDRLFRVEDQPVEIEDESTDHGSKA
jgi:hypothetical protein